MRTHSVVLWTLFVTLGCLGGVKLQGENQQEQTVVTDNDVDRRQLTPFEEGLQPFYEMTNIFVGLLQTKDFATENPELYKAIHDMVISTTNGSQNGNTQPEPDITGILLDNWQSLVLYSVAYAVCIIVGILFIIIMPIVGCCFCCCRLCDNCGGKTKPREGRLHRCRQYTCGTLLFIFNTIMLVGMIFAFMTNEQIRIRFSANDGGLVSRARQSVTTFKEYRQILVSDIDKNFNIELEGQLNMILQKLRSLPNAAVKRLDTVVNSTSLLKQADTLATDVEKMKGYLTNIDNTKTVLTTNITSLTSRLNDVKTEVEAILNNCNDQECTALLNDLQSIQIEVDFSKADQDVTAKIDMLNNVGDLKSQIEMHEENYNSIKSKVNDSINAELNEAEKIKVKIWEDIAMGIKDISNAIYNNTKFVEDIDGEFGNIQTQIRSYADYEWYAGIGLSCVFLLIVLCYYLGLMFGVCGEPPYEDASACNKGVGANLLLAGVGFCFLFSWLLMLVCTLLFIPGAIIQGEVCRHFSPDIKNSSYLMIIDEVTYPYLKDANLTQNVSQMIGNCKANQGVYTALGLQNIIDLNWISLDGYDIENKINQLKNQAVTGLDTVEIVDDATKAELRTIGDSAVDDINFDAFFEELNKGRINSGDLTGVIERLESVKSKLPQSDQDNLDAEIRKLEAIKTDIEALDNTMGDLRVNLDKLKAVIEGHTGQMSLKQKTEALITSLENAQTSINTNAQIKIQELFTETGDDVLEDLRSFITDTKYKIKNDLGRCRRLYNIASRVINVVCVDALYPFNGFWFSFGWCLAFFIPAIITAVHLAGSYRKTEEYDPTDTKSFDDPNFDAYSGGMFPGDNIPLEDYDRRKNRPGGRGHPNSAYETDGHPSSRAPPAAMPYRDNYSRDNYARNGGPPAYSSNQGGYGGRGGGYGGATPPNPPHYYNNRPGPY